MQIRTFENKDADSARDLIISILSNEYPFDKSVYKNSDLSDISQAYGGKRDAFFVMESDGKIVGTVGVKEDSEDIALIRRLFVIPSYRQKGYGSLLLDKAICSCKDFNFKHIAFRTTGKMIQAINLLKKMNFKEVEKINLDDIQIYKFVLDL